MSQPWLSAGAVKRILDGRPFDTGPPHLQVVQIRKVHMSDQRERFRVVLSDGVQYVHGVLASAMNALVTREELRENTVVRLDEFAQSTFNHHFMCHCARVTVLRQLQQCIGTPTNVVQPSGTRGAAPVQVAAPPPPCGTPRPPSSSAATVNPPAFQPVSSLNPYQKRWRIKVRVTAKNAVRHFHNARGEGKVSSVDLLDQEGGEIVASMFNGAVDRWWPVLRKGRVYLVSRGVITMARKKFTHIRNDYAITLSADAVVQVPPPPTLGALRFM